MTMQIEDAVKRALSADRMGTYENAVARLDTRSSPLELYLWNARISAAFLVPLHIGEVVIRNAVSDALTRIHGPRWPWVQGFADSLPSPSSGYNPRCELQRATTRCSHGTAQVVSTLSFVFWQKMFTQRFDVRVWSRCMGTVLPGASEAAPRHVTRARIHNDLEQIRRLRNRIAHHEPIFARALDEDFAAIQRLVALRCTRTADWMAGHEAVTPLLRNRPP